MIQPEGFIKEKVEHLVCTLRGSLYGLNQATMGAEQENKYLFE